MAASLLLLSAADVAALLDPDTCRDAVEAGFRLHAEGQGGDPGVLGVHVPGGGFHIKAAALPLARRYFAAKCNANFPANPARHGLPTIQGLLLLADAERGVPLAVMDSGELTALRTAAATAVAARYSARENAATLTVCGCGRQAAYQLHAVDRVRPLRRIFAWDVDPGAARAFAAAESARGRLVEVAPSLADALAASDMVVTCTTARAPVLLRGDVKPGTFVAAVGADHADKQEIDPALLAASTVVTDLTGQCATIGDLHHAIASGVMREADVYAELGEVVIGKRPGRRSASEIVVFDSTGTALQDVAAAAVVYERALAAGRGTSAQL